MKRYISYIVIAVVFAVAGYFFGEYISMKRAIKGLGIGNLSVMTALHQKIANEQYSEANAAIERWMDSQVAVLAAVDKYPLYVWRQIAPWKVDPMKRLAPKFLKDANEYFGSKPDALRPETRAYFIAAQSSSE